MLETHACALPGCREACPSSHLMCIRHWRMVPSSLRRMVRVAFNVWRRAVSGRLELQIITQRAGELRKAQQMATHAVLEKEAKRDLKRQEGQDPLFS